MIIKTTKTALLLFCINWVVFSGCSSKTEPRTEPLPSLTWAQGCVELAPDQGTYRLTGLCCTSISFPSINLNKNRTFSVTATYFTFNGAGFINFPVVVNGDLSPDESTLILNYSINSTLTSHTLKLGQPKVSCDCGCD